MFVFMVGRMLELQMLHAGLATLPVVAVDVSNIETRKAECYEAAVRDRQSHP